MNNQSNESPVIVENVLQSLVSEALIPDDTEPIVLSELMPSLIISPDDKELFKNNIEITKDKYEILIKDMSNDKLEDLNHLIEFVSDMVQQICDAIDTIDDVNPAKRLIELKIESFLGELTIIQHVVEDRLYK